MPNHAEIVAAVCSLIADGEHDAAKAKLVAEYPCAMPATRRKTWPLKQYVRVFARDGYTDRYSGKPLVFPGALRALTLLMGDAFPYHPNWKQGATHPAFWELYPTIDHKVSLARGGADDESNAVTTSMYWNLRKLNGQVDEFIDSELAPICPRWDGLVPWFVQVYDSHPALRDDASIRRWRAALR